MAKTVHCPTCGAPVAWTPAARDRPFCSERCRLLDLGAWFDERHRVSGPSASTPWSAPHADAPGDAAAAADDPGNDHHGRAH